MDWLLRGRRKALEISKALLEIAFEEAKAIRKDALRLVEMAMCSVQWEELERLELHTMWLGMESCRPSARNSADPTDSRYGRFDGRRTRHGEADKRPVPGRDGEEGNLDDSDTQSSSSWCKTGFSPCETSTSKKSLRDGAEDVNHGKRKNGRDDNRAGASGHSSGKCEEESGSSYRNGDRSRLTPEYAETAHEHSFERGNRTSCQDRRRNEGDE